MKFRISLILILFFYAHGIFTQTRSIKKTVKLKETAEGEKLYSQGKYDEAIQVFKTAIKNGETHGDPQFYIGSIYESRRQYDEAIPYFQDAARRELHPKFREATLWKLVLLLRKQENFAEMIGYIDLLEEMGIKHENLDKFREEAEINLAPEKVKARTLIKEAKKITSEWQSENRDNDFWASKENSQERNLVLEKYTEAVSLDDSLFQLYWEIAGFYEATGDSVRAVEIYEKIIAKNQDPEAYYKVGVIARKNGDFLKAREYLLTAEKAVSEDSDFRYYLRVNLSQTLYALEDYENGIKFSLSQGEEGDENDLSYDDIIHCLHLAGKKGTLSEYHQKQLQQHCRTILPKSDLAKKDIRFITLYYFMRAETQRALLEKSDSHYDRQVRAIVDDYARALFPPTLRAVPLKGLKFKAHAENYEDAFWAALPLWSMPALGQVIEYFESMKYHKELYLALHLYEAALKEKQGEVFYEKLASVSYTLALYDESISSYKQIENRNVKQEIGLLMAYLYLPAWEEFQNEFMHYLEAHPEHESQMKEFLLTQPEMKKISPDKFNPVIQKILGYEEKADENLNAEEDIHSLESGQSPADSPVLKPVQPQKLPENSK